MSNIFGWANALTGGVDPYQEERDYADNAQKRNRTALGLDENGNPLPPPDPNQPAQSAAAGQAAASGVMPQGQQPNATKTDPSLGHVLVDLQQYQEREQGFEQGLGGMGAAISRPENRSWVRGLFNTTPPDPIKSVQSQMDLAGQQQSQDRMNSLGLSIQNPTTALQIAQSLHMPGATPEAQIAALQAAYRANPQSISQMLTQTQQPTPQMANLEQIQQFQKQFKTEHPEASDSDLSDLATIIKAGVAGDKAQAMVLAQNAFKAKFGHDPSWKNNPDGFAVYTAQQGQRQEALNVRPISEGKVQDLENKVDAIENDPALPGLMKRLVPGQGILSLVGYNDAERGLLQKIKQATSDEYVRGLADPGLGTRKTQQEMQYVGQSLGGVLNASNINYSDYKAGLERLKDQLAITHADIYGQSGDFTGLDEKYHGYVNDAYRPGGALSEGISGAPARKPLDDAAKQFWTSNQGKVPRAALLEHLRNLNYDTSGLK